MVFKKKLPLISLLAFILISSTTIGLNFLTKISRMTANTTHFGPDIVKGKPLTIYSHGLLCNKWVGGLHHCDSSIHSPNAFIQGPMVSFSYKDWLSPFSTCVGQEDDLEQLHSVCKNHTHIIAAGCSRGAGAIISYLGIYKPTNILGAVIESPFDHTSNVIHYIADQINIHKQSFIDKITGLLAPNHKPDGIQPIDHVSDISKDIPLLFICSTKDRVIPLPCCINLYKKAIESGHTKVHILITQHGAHGLITISSDGTMMRNVIHAFYKEYGLPHNEQWAHAGKERFKQCQPTVEELERLKL